MPTPPSSHTPHDATAREDDSPRLPEQATAPLYGPDPLGQGVLRGILLTAAGWFGGNWFGNLGSKPEFLANGERNPRYHSFKARYLGGTAAFVGGVMGAYGGIKNARMHARQVHELQDIVKQQHEENMLLKADLKAQPFQIIEARGSEHTLPERESERSPV